MSHEEEEGQLVYLEKLMRMASDSERERILKIILKIIYDDTQIGDYCKRYLIDKIEKEIK